MEINMNVNTEKMVKTMLEKEGRRLTKELSAKFGFNEEEGLKLLRLDDLKVKKEVSKELKKDKTNKITLPFCGVKLEDCCEGIRLNHGLYTQCTNEITDEDNKLCKTCSNQKDKNSNGEPTYGYIDDRIKLGDKFRDPKGKPPVNYGNVMDKLKITRDEAEREATNQGLTIPENEFAVKKSQRGRPKKTTIANDTSGSDDDNESVKKSESPKKKQGRPKKEKKEVTSSGKDLLKSLVKKSQDAEKKENSEELCVEKEDTKLNNDSDDEATDKDNEENEENDDDDAEEELRVVEITIKGKKYLRSSDNVLFDIKTHEEIGIYDEITEEIIEE